MAAFLDICRFTPSAGGTTDWTVAGAVTGYQTPAAAGAVNGRAYKYRAESADLSQWEIGEGTYNTSTGVLSRTTVLFTSAGTTAKISFTAAPQVAVVAIKEDLLSVEEANSFTDAQKAQARANVYAAPFDALAFNGMQVNGNMEVSQQYGTTAVAGGAVAYVLDGFGVYPTGTMAVSSQQVTDAPPGYANSLKLSVTTAEATLGANDYVIIHTPIEGYRVQRLAFGTASAQPVSIGFWVKANRAGQYGGAIRNSADTRAYPFSFTISAPATWQYITVTIPGDTAGTWATGTNVGLALEVCMAAGATYLGAAGAWAAGNYISATGQINGVAATSDYFQLTGVVILPGIELPSASRAPLIMRPYAQELLLCQRYFYNGVPALRGAVLTSVTIAQRLACNHPVAMRANPTVTLASPLPVTDSAGISTVTAIATNYSTTTVLEIDGTGITGLVADRPCLVYQGAGGNILVDARL